MADRTDPKTLVNNIVVDTKALAQDNIALAKAEVQPIAKNAGLGGGMFGAAGYLGINGVSLLFMAGGLAFGLLFQHVVNWGYLAAASLGFVAMAIVLFLIAGILAMVGKKKVDAVKDGAKNMQAPNEAKATIEQFKTSAKAGVNQVEADIRDRKGLSRSKKAAKDLDLAETSTGTVASTGSGAHEAPTA